MNQKLTDHQPIASKARKPFILWFILFSFLSPAILAVYFYATGFLKGAPLKQHGVLMKSPLTIDAFLDKKSLNLQEIQKNKWKLIYFNKKTCSAYCEQRLYFLRQIHVALGRDASRVQHIFITLAPLTSLQQKKLNELNFLTIKNSTYPSSFKNSLPSGVFIIDPLNHVVLFYDETVSPKNILIDLRHLLKFSQIG